MKQNLELKNGEIQKTKLNMINCGWSGYITNLERGNIWYKYNTIAII